MKYDKYSNEKQKWYDVPYCNVMLPNTNYNHYIVDIWMIDYSFMNMCYEAYIV